MKKPIETSALGRASTALTLALMLFTAGCASQKFTLGTARVAAERGNAQAEYFLSKAYANGQGVPQNYPKAIEYLRQSASQGNAEAQNDLGAFYAQGLGVPQDYTEAVKWFRLAAGQGDPLAEYSLGVSYALARGLSTNMDEAVKWYGRAAAQDQLDAQLELGDIYLGGRGLPADYRASRKWFKMAAAQNSVRAVNALGFIHERGGFGVVKDPPAAVKYYRQAAIAGDGKGQANLGRMYLNGIGVQPDFIEAYKWFYLANKTGGGTGRHYMSELEGKHNYGDFKGDPLTPEQIKEAVRRAEELQTSHSKPVNTSNTMLRRA